MRITKSQLQKIIKEEIKKTLSEQPDSWTVWVLTPHDGPVSLDILGEISEEDVEDELKIANRHYPGGVRLIAVINDQTQEIIKRGVDYKSKSNDEVLAAIKEED